MKLFVISSTILSFSVGLANFSGNGSKNLTINPTMIDDWSPELFAKLPCGQGPVMAHFKKGAFELYYIGAQHGYGPTKTNETFQMVDNAIDLKPSFLVLEHIEAAAGENPRTEIEKGFQCEKDNFRHCIETHFAVNEASKKQIPFIGGEPSLNETLSTLKTDNFNSKDLACLRWMIALGPEMNQKHFDGITQDVLQNREALAKKIKNETGVQMSFSDFAKCYSEKMGKPFSFSDVNDQTFAPFKGVNSTYFNNVMHSADKAREKSIIQMIAKTLNQKSPVLAVFGIGHLSKHLRALSSALGEPQFLCAPKRLAAPVALQPGQGKK